MIKQERTEEREFLKSISVISVISCNNIFLFRVPRGYPRSWTHPTSRTNTQPVAVLVIVSRARFALTNTS